MGHNIPLIIIEPYDENGVPNAMNAAWGIQSDYVEITLFLAKYKSTDKIKKTKAFTVAMVTKDTVVISDYFGVETLVLTSKYHPKAKPYISAGLAKI